MICGEVPGPCPCPCLRLDRPLCLCLCVDHGRGPGRGLGLCLDLDLDLDLDLVDPDLCPESFRALCGLYRRLGPSLGLGLGLDRGRGLCRDPFLPARSGWSCVSRARNRRRCRRRTSLGRIL